MPKNMWQERARSLLTPIVEGLARLGVTPTAVTLLGLLLNIMAGVAAGMGRAFEAGLVLIVAGICDALDGQLARRTGRVSRFGAFLDSTIDRIDESAVLCGIAAWFLRRGGATGDAMAVACLAALAGSIITSYTRARAEGLGLECKVGFFERPERVVVTIVGLLAGPRALTGAILIVVFFSWLTVLQRIAHVRRLVLAQERLDPVTGTPAAPGLPGARAPAPRGRCGTRAGSRTLNGSRDRADTVPAPRPRSPFWARMQPGVPRSPGSGHSPWI